MKTRLRKAAKYIAIPAMLLTSGLSSRTQSLFVASQDKGALDQSTIARTSLGAFTAGESGAGGRMTSGANVVTPSGHSAKGVSVLDQAREVSREAI